MFGSSLVVQSWRQAAHSLCAAEVATDCDGWVKGDTAPCVPHANVEVEPGVFESEIDEAVSGVSNDIAWRQVALRDRIASRVPGLPGRWQTAIENVARHVLVPGFWRQQDSPGNSVANGWYWTDITQGNRDALLDEIYSDAPLVVSIRNAPRGGVVDPIAASSSTTPSEVVKLIACLDPQYGERVLEIGTGPGYSTALLSYALGASQVTSVELSSSVADITRRRLAGHGMRPRLMVADGSAKVADTGGFDHILSMCAVDAIPNAWIEQCKPGGTILTNIYGPLTCEAQIRLTSFGDGVAMGRFQAGSGGFLALHRHADYTQTVHRRSAYRSHGTNGHTQLAPSELYGDRNLALVAQLRVADLTSVWIGERTLHLRAADQSWAAIRLDVEAGKTSHVLEQGGPRLIWTELESAYESWLSEGRPELSRYGLTLSPSGADVWLDHPGNIVWQ